MKMSKNVLITGATGFVGTYLTEFLIDRGYDVIILSRSAKGNKGNVAYWNPERGEIDIEALKRILREDGRIRRRHGYITVGP